MKVMLISPPNILKGNIKEESSFENRITPLDLAIIGAVLEKKHHVEILDALALGLNKEDILKNIDKFNPDLICLTAFDRCRWGVDVANELSKYIEHRDKKLGLIWSYKPEFMIPLMENNKNIDFSIYGDPEYTLLELADKNSFKDIKGVIYREGENIIKNNPRELIKDLDILPFPARHLLKLNAYKRLPHELMKEPNFDMLVSRGCPYNCIFCLLKIVGGKIWRTRSPNKVIEEIKMLKEQGARQIHFQDLTFTLNRNWTIELCDLLIKENLGLVWTCQTRVDKVDSDLLNLMKKAGCRSILYGIESLDQEALDKIKKDVRESDMRKAIILTKKQGIESRCSLMIGLPGETKKSVFKTIDLLIKLNPSFIQVHTTMAFPGTELYEDNSEYGKIIEDTTIKKYDLSGHLFIPKAYKNKEEILEIQKAAYKKFYFRPKYILGKVLNIKQLSRNWRGLKIFSKM